MPFNKSPQELIKGWAAESDAYTIPSSFLAALSKVDSNPETGDSRAIVYSFIEAFYQWYNHLPLEDRPTKLQINRASYVDDVTNAISRTYTVSISTLPTSLSVADEQPNSYES